VLPSSALFTVDPLPLSLLEMASFKIRFAADLFNTKEFKMGTINKEQFHSRWAKPLGRMETDQAKIETTRKTILSI
jgi:hypothetical protein